MTKRKDPKDFKPDGRPTDYTEELGILICSRIGQGNSLTKVCAMDDTPSVQTVYTWFKKYPEFLEDYARSKEDSGDADQDKLDEIAEKVLTGVYEPQQARVAADIIKWSASKKKPKKYGDKQQIEHSGKIGLADRTDEELARRLEELENDS